MYDRKVKMVASVINDVEDSLDSSSGSDVGVIVLNQYNFWQWSQPQ